MGISWSTNTLSFSNAPSQLMVDLLSDSHLSQVIDKPTRFRRNQRPSTLDFILTSDEKSISSIEYCDPISKSDHTLIKTELQICLTTDSRTTVIQKFITDWEMVRTEVALIDWNQTLRTGLYLKITYMK